ncbi:MAG: COP23 domain-containing protein, partial [Trichormus sp.]
MQISRLLAQLLPAVASLTSFLALGFAVIKPIYAGSNKFFCTQEGNIPVTKVRTSRGPETFIRWVVQDFKKFPPSERCRIVSVRFQRYYDNGLLFITTRRNFNNYDVICIAHRQNVPCRAEDVLVTLKPGTDMTRVLKQILAFG